LPEDRFDDQPHFDDRFMFVADVRLDNRADLIGALGLNSSESKEVADSELLFCAWRRWQLDCLDRVVGDYAFAVHDRRSGTLVLARDPIGQRPLFYARLGDATIFASMPSGILPHGRFVHDRIRIAQRLAGQEDESTRSYFEAIARVLSGETVIITGDRIERRRWTPVTDALTGRSGDDLREELRERVDTAVASCMRRVDGPLATHLSSGYDSSTVTATAALLGDKRDVVAFTSAPATDLRTATVDRRIVDESTIAAETARFLGIDHEVVRTSEPLLDRLRGHTRYYQEPVRNLLNMGWYAEIERRAVQRGAKVLLLGELGNLTLSAGGLPVLADWIRAGAWGRWWKEAKAASRRDDARWRGIVLNSFRLFLPERATEELARLFQGQPRWNSACFARAEALDRLPSEATPRPRNAAAERLRIMRGFDAGVFRKGSLAKHGIDERDPTADRRLIEFTLRLPPEQLLHDGVYKPLARSVLSDRLPPSVLDAPLRGYQGADWVSRIDKADALATLEEISSNSTVLDVIDVPRLKARIEDWPDPEKAGHGEILAFGRHVTNALAMGVFIIESEDPTAMGR
jgi:asparagine synthase (glutamine-hydrolysing)